MKFPGKRKTKHYFPVSEETRTPLERDLTGQDVYVVGIDQLIVDIEIHVEDEYLEKHGFVKGESQIATVEVVEKIYREAQAQGTIKGEFAGGSTGNTLHNYAVLSDDTCVALGAINANITVGDYAYKYICTTNSHVDLTYLKPCPGPMARAMCFITPDKERTFVIGKGIMNELSEDFIPDDIVKGASSLLISSYLFRDQVSPMFKATLKAVKVAKDHDVPVVLSLGTGMVVKDQKEFLVDFIRDYVSIVAGNEQEVELLIDQSDPLLALEKTLDLCDMVLLTVGKSGLYLGAHCDEEQLRQTKDQIHSKSISEYNLYEYSRAMLKKNCSQPTKVYTHINPFMGGPGKIENTNGAGDAALSALLHDISANDYHRLKVPNGPKHNSHFLTYSSIHQVAKYANRASFEVLNQNSPRLTKGLPEREDSLEDGYWEL
ncbi:MAG: inosine/guanosine kinase [Halobacteriovoraceae bacterium]|nr:inosine/guanosine kinase [Halobacteriovoraceae bacterium]